MLENKIDRKKFLKLGTVSAAVGAAMLLNGCEDMVTSIDEDAVPVKRMAMMMDTSSCIECYACVLACKNHNAVPLEQSYIRFDSVEKGTFPDVKYNISRHSCMHCNDAPCVGICPVKALRKGTTGFTHVDFDTCIGCGLCKSVCPFDVPVIADSPEGKRKMYKCVGCEDLVNADKEPACANTCVAKCIGYGEVEEMIKLAKERVEKIKGKFPNANVYGTTQQDGLGLIMVMRDDPKEFGLI